MNEKANRRQFLKISILGLAGASAAVAGGRTILPTNLNLPNPYPGFHPENQSRPEYNKGALFFNEHQYNLVAALAALIIPSDTTPGATEARVVDKLDSLVSSTPDLQEIYRNGLEWMDTVSVEEFGSGKLFLELPVSQQIELLQKIDEAQQLRSRQASNLIEKINCKFDRLWVDYFGVGPNASFFATLREDVIRAFYSDPIAWKEIGFYGPPQPEGYLDFSKPPSAGFYKKEVRYVQSSTCKNCHEDVKHPTGGLIDYSCKRCHQPHSPWLDENKAFHLENHIRFVFPSPDRKKENR